MTRTRALAQVREECPEFSEADLDRLIDAGRVDWRLVEGEQRFLPSFLDALRKYPEEVPGLACPAPSRADRLGVIAEMRENGAAERRIRLRASIAAGTDVRVGPETRVRCWLPVPAACPQICDARVIDATPDAQIAEADARQRTAYWDVRGRREFFVDYECTVRAPTLTFGRRDSCPRPRMSALPLHPRLRSQTCPSADPTSRSRRIFVGLPRASSRGLRRRTSLGVRERPMTG